jgi:hypothetical protein
MENLHNFIARQLSNKGRNGKVCPLLGVAVLGIRPKLDIKNSFPKQEGVNTSLQLSQLLFPRCVQFFFLKYVPSQSGSNELSFIIM